MVWQHSKTQRGPRLHPRVAQGGNELPALIEMAIVDDVVCTL